jgi:hypothetical protein
MKETLKTGDKVEKENLNLLLPDSFSTKAILATLNLHKEQD